MNVSKPRPNDHPLLVLFIVGGITCSEVHQIREALAAYHPNTQVNIDTLKNNINIIIATAKNFHLLGRMRKERNASLGFTLYVYVKLQITLFCLNCLLSGD